MANCVSTFLTFQSAVGNADFGPIAKEIALNNLYPIRADAIISLFWTYPLPGISISQCQIGVADTALLILPSGNFYLPICLILENMI